MPGAAQRAPGGPPGTPCAWQRAARVVISLAIASRYGVPLHVPAQVCSAILLTAFAGTMLGCALGHAMPSPMTTGLITQILIFPVFAFTPILFPARQVPSWLAGLNWWLPFGHMAVIVQAGLTTGLVTAVASSYLIVAAWAMAGAPSGTGCPACGGCSGSTWPGPDNGSR